MGNYISYRNQCVYTLTHLPLVPHIWASYQIRKIAGCACAGNAGNVFPRRRFQRKPLVSDPGMHHGTCVTHVPWCMSGSLTCGDGENVPGIPGACAPANLRIWQEAHVSVNGVSIGSDNSLSPVRCQAITWTKTVVLSIGLIGTNFNEIRIVILSFSFKKIHLKMSSAKMAAILSRGRWVKRVSVSIAFELFFMNS